MLLRLLFLFVLVGAVACDGGADSRGAGSPPLDGGVPSSDTPAGADALATDGGGAVDGDDLEDASVETATHECTDERYVDRSAGSDGDRTISTTRGNRYAPPCMLIRVGQSVTFTGSFSAHPLAPGVAPGRSGVGTTPSPIEMRTEGTTYTVRFMASGDFPYHCTYHAGGGMYGVVRAVP